MKNKEIVIGNYFTSLKAKHLLNLLWLFPLLMPNLLVSAKIACVISGFFWLRYNYLKNRQRKNLDLVERIQDDLGVDFAIFHYKPSAKKSIMGGFMVPLLPFYARVRSKRMFIEAAIHEHIHIAWMVYGFQTAFIYILLYFATLLPAQYHYWVGGFVILCWLLLQEWLAFTSVETYVSKSRIKSFKPRTFSGKLVIKYILFYGSLIPIFSLLRPLIQIRISLYLLCVIMTIWLLSKLWYYIFERLGWNEVIK